MTERGRRPKRLRPWLIALIDSGEIPGLEWLDDTKTLFRVPWLHKNRQCWKTEDGQIFMEWAKHTGKYVEGVTQTDYAGWKQRLRSAFNKASDMVYEKEMSRQQSTDASQVKIYRLLSLPYPQRTPSRNTETSVQPSSSDENLEDEGGDDGASGFQILEGSSEESCWSKPVTSSESKAAGRSRLPNLKIFDEPLLGDSSYSSQAQESVSESEMHINISYCGHIVVSKTVNNQHGCRISYTHDDLPNPEMALTANFLQCENIYQMDEIVLPTFQMISALISDERLNQGMELLQKGMRQILVLKCDEHSNIFAYRLCKCAVFHYSEAISGTSVKLPRGSRDNVLDSPPTESLPLFRKLFDYSQDYIPALKDYLEGKRAKPCPYLTLVLGQKVSRQECIDDNTLIHITVTTNRALEDLDKAVNSVSSRSPMVEMSASNEFDRLVSGVDYGFEGLEEVVQDTIGEVTEMDLQYSPDDTDCNWGLNPMF